MSQRQVKERDKEREKEAGLQTPNREHIATPSTLSPGISYSHDNGRVCGGKAGQEDMMEDILALGPELCSDGRSRVGQIGLFPDPPCPSTLSFLTAPLAPPPRRGSSGRPHDEGGGLLSRRRFSTCGGTASLRPPHPDGRKLIRNASFGGYNELSPISLPGFERGKEDLLPLPLKEDSHSISKSKSETKLYNGSDKDVSTSGGKLTKKESLKVQRKTTGRKEEGNQELLSTITDPSVIVMADWLKIRGTLKSWTKLWCVLKPGVLLIYKTHKNGQWVGTVLLNACELIERPSKKDGFCFKLFHPLEQSIWAVKVRIS
ncbi:hypothetical protein INR49_021835 [Caranx melampygus]|nr:hypothetical protein INR49_021835 [Caranx melampygus]